LLAPRIRPRYQEAHSFCSYLLSCA
jgi:hypothetical protein